MQSQEISLEVKKLSTTQERVVGLIGKGKPEPVLIKTRFGIHTFGLKFSIDAVVLDKHKHVVRCKENLKPFRVFVWNPKHDTILELPHGTIRHKSIKKGDKIHFALS